MRERKYCPSCGALGYPVKTSRGKFLTEILLWFLCLVPGIAYSIWRLTTTAEVCPACGNPGLLPAMSPRALADQNRKEFGGTPVVGGAPTLLGLMLGILAVTLLASLAFFVWNTGPYKAYQTMVSESESRARTFVAAEEILKSYQDSGVLVWRVSTQGSGLGEEVRVDQRFRRLAASEIEKIARAAAALPDSGRTEASVTFLDSKSGRLLAAWSATGGLDCSRY